MGFVAVTRKPLRFEDVYQIPEDAPYRFNVQFDEKSGYRSKSLLSVAMSNHRDQLIGVVQLWNKKRNARIKLSPSNTNDQAIPFDEGDFDLLACLASQAAVAIENAGLYRQAQEMIRSRDQFLSIASHELRTPLTAMILQLKVVLRKAEAGEKSHNELLTVERHVENMTTMVNNLLDISRIQAGRLELHLEEVDLGVVVREVLAKYKEVLNQNGCSLQVREHGPVMGRWDRARIAEVVSSLLSNAAKFGRGKPIAIEITADSENGRFTIQDSGIGIAPEDSERIFERFERAVSERNYGGFGLGLWVARQVVEAMHGNISVESRPDEGAKFTVLLPKSLSSNRA